MQIVSQLFNIDYASSEPLETLVILLWWFWGGQADPGHRSAKRCWGKIETVEFPKIEHWFRIARSPGWTLAEIKYSLHKINNIKNDEWTAFSLHWTNPCIRSIILYNNYMFKKLHKLNLRGEKEMGQTLFKSCGLHFWGDFI